MELHVATTQNLVSITVVYCVVMMQVAWKVLLVMCGHNAIITDAWKIYYMLQALLPAQILKLHLGYPMYIRLKGSSSYCQHSLHSLLSEGVNNVHQTGYITDGQKLVRFLIFLRSGSPTKHARINF